MFDNGSLVADAGLLLAGTVVQRLGVAGGAAVSGDGAADAGGVLEVVHVRACAPARQAAEHAQRRAWSVGAAPDIAEMTVDLQWPETSSSTCGASTAPSRRTVMRPSNSGWSSKKRSPQLPHESRRRIQTNVVRRPGTSRSRI